MENIKNVRAALKRFIDAYNSKVGEEERLTAKDFRLPKLADGRFGCVERDSTGDVGEMFVYDPALDEFVPATQ